MDAYWGNKITEQDENLAEAKTLGVWDKGTGW